MVLSMTWTEFKKRWELFTEGVVNDFVAELKRVAPVDTGFLAASIGYRPIGKNWEIYMPDYALYVEFGTPPHVIKPRKKKALAFARSGGRRVQSNDGKVSTEFTFGGKTHKTSAVFAKVVHHPGTRAQPFIRNTISTKLNEIIIQNLENQFT